MSGIENWSQKRILITGVCGTVGRELLCQLLALDPLEVVGVDNNESVLFFQSEKHASQRNLRLYLGDVRDRDKLRELSRGVDIVLHLAALKHVILCEQSPGDAVQTNIQGVQNVIDAALEAKVERVIFTSSDKAVNPTNVMGTSKLMGERLMTAANALRRGTRPIFASTRFGNVLGSRGSVVPLFKRQISRGGPITLTDPAMTRFVTTMQDAVRLVLESTYLACGGEVFVPKMPAIRISDLAIVMRESLASAFGYRPADIEIRVVGGKPGEKLYEELMNEEEVRRTVELATSFAVLPAFKSVYAPIEYSYSTASDKVSAGVYNSASVPVMSRGELMQYLLEHGLLNSEKDLEDSVECGY